MIKSLNIRKIGLLFLALALTIGSLTMMAGAQGDVSANFSVKANLPDNQRNLNKSYFDLHMTPEQKQRITVDIINFDSSIIFVTISANNAYTNHAGGIEYMQPNVKDESLIHGFSDIATLSSERLEIPANSSATVSVDLEMPKELYDGEIIGGLVFTKEIEESENNESIALVNRYNYAIGVVLSDLSIGTALLLSVSALLMPVGAVVADEKDTAANIEFTQGTLLISSIPAFDFGIHTITTGDEVYTGTATGNMAVADARGSAAGWNLGVSLKAFSNDAGLTTSLNGAKIKITPSAAYTTTGSGVLPGTVATFVELISGDTAVKNITIAALGQGTGLMENVISASEITVCGSTASPGGHSAVIDWTLGDTP